MKALPGGLLGKCLLLALALGTAASCNLSLFEMPTTKELHFEQRLFGRYLEITVDNTGITEQLEDFPVLVRLDNSRISDPELLDPALDRFRFYDESGNPLAFDVESYDPLGDTFIWVKVPRIEADSNSTRFFLYFDLDPRHDGLTPAPRDVWSNGYLGVWHLSETTAAGPRYYSDRSGNYNTGTSELDDLDPDTPIIEPDPLTGPAPAAGRIAGGQRIVNLSDGIRIDPSFTQDLGPMSLSFWINADAVTAAGRLFHKGDSTSTPLDVYCADGTGTMNTEIHFDTAPLLLEQSGELGGAVGSWRWYCINWTGTAECGGSGVGDDELNGVFVYLDGVWQNGNRVVQDGVGTYPVGDRYTAAYIGNAWWTTAGLATAGFPGTFDEVRVSTVARSPRWIEAQYRSMTTDTYLNYAPEVIIDW